MPHSDLNAQPAGPAFTYRAIVTSIYDGDTMTVDIDLGFHSWMRSQKIRLYGVDTPEIRGEERPEGLKVKAELLKICLPGTHIILQSLKDKSGKYGRWLGIVWPTSGAIETSLNQWLLDNGMAEPYPRKR